MIISFMVIVIFIHEHRTNIFNKGYLFAEGEVIIGEYSPRRIGEIFTIIAEPEANNCFSIISLVKHV